MGGVPVVFVHGLRTSRTMWRAQVAAVEAAGHRALAVDLPGHGERTGEEFTLGGAVEAVRAAVGQVTGVCGRGVADEGTTSSRGRALVVGLSLGGYVGIAHAARHPEQVAGLVAASCCTRPRPAVVGAWEAASRAILRLPDRGAALNDAMVRAFLPAQGAADASAGGFAFDVMTSALREMARADTLGDLRRVSAPVWLVNGRYDHFRSEERAFLAACRDGRLVVVPGATHLVSLVRPTRFTRTVLEALVEVDARADAEPGVESGAGLDAWWRAGSSAESDMRPGVGSDAEPGGGSCTGPGTGLGTAPDAQSASAQARTPPTIPASFGTTTTSSPSRSSTAGVMRRELPPPR